MTRKRLNRIFAEEAMAQSNGQAPPTSKFIERVIEKPMIVQAKSPKIIFNVNELKELFEEGFQRISDQIASKNNVQAFSNVSGLTKKEFSNVIRNVDDILAPYKITDKDDDSSPNYYGFTKSDGSWYILKETVSAGADTYRFVKGLSSYTTNWTNRASLSYDYFYSVF